MKRVNVAIAGTGFGVRTILPCIKVLQQAKVLAICGGQNRERTGEIAKTHDIPIFDQDFSTVCRSRDIDLVFIASPHQYHYEMVTRALDNQKHIVCEKPLALNLSEMNELISKSRGSTRLHLVNHQLRFHPAIRKIRELIRSGDLGRPYHIHIAYQTDRYVDPRLNKNRWWFDPNVGGGMVIAMGSHLIDLIQFWFGDIVSSVYAHLDPVLDYFPSEKGIRERLRAESAFTCCINLKNNTSVNINCTAVAYRRTFLDISAFGTRAELLFRAPNQLRVYTIKNGRRSATTLYSNKDYVSSVNGSIFHYSFKLFAKAIIEALITDNLRLMKDATDFEDFLYKYRILEAMKMSYQNNEVITIG